MYRRNIKMVCTRISKRSMNIYMKGHEGVINSTCGIRGMCIVRIGVGVWYIGVGRCEWARTKIGRGSELRELRMQVQLR
jgi:hypothetical protein